MKHLFSKIGFVAVAAALLLVGGVAYANLQVITSLPVHITASATVNGSNVTLSVGGGLSTAAHSEQCVEDAANPDGPAYTSWYTAVGEQTDPVNTAHITSGTLSGQTIPLSVEPGVVGTDCYTNPGSKGDFSGSRTFTNVAPGSHTVNIRVTDDRGRTGNVSVSFTVAAAPVPPTCSASASTVTPGQTVTFTGANGSGYTWTTSGGSTNSGSGNTFSTSYASSGTKTVTVTSNGQSGSCSVQVSAPATPSCSPGTQTVNIGDSVSLSATGGTSGNYTWSASGASPATPSGTNNANLSVTYATTGIKNITVSRNGVTSSACTVNVNDPNIQEQPTLSLSASPNPVAVNTTPTLVWSVANAQTCTDNPDRWYWSGPFDATVGTHSSSSVSPHTVAGETRNYTMTCTNSAGSVTDSVDVATEEAAPATPSCSPSSQSATVGVPVSLSAAGGTSGSYTWSATGASPATPSGTNNAHLSVTYSTVGNKTVTVTRNGVTSGACTVSVAAAPPATTPVCSPGSQNATVGSASTLTATGGTSGAYTWVANGASGAVTSGTNNETLSVTYATPGAKSVRVGRNGTNSSWCTVTVAEAPTGTGTIVVNSNRSTTWSLSGSQDLVQSSPATHATYTDVTVGTYTISAAQLSGYSLEIAPATSQYLSDGVTRTFTLVYTPQTGAGVDITANPTSVETGGSSILSWTSHGIISGTCAATGGWSGSKTDNGSQGTGALSSETAFTITCNVAGSGKFDSGSTVSDSVTVTIGDEPGGENPGGGTPQCSDTADNDGDGFIDFSADPGCEDALDNNEIDGDTVPGDDDDGPGTINHCDDGFDNDGDGTIDESDAGCAGDSTDERGIPDIREI